MRKALSGFLTVGVGQGGARVLSFLISIWIARHLSIEAFGIFSIGYVIMTLVAQIPQVFDSTFVKFYTGAPEHEKPLLLNTQFVFKLELLLLSFFVGGLVWFYYPVLGWGIIGGGLWGFYHGIIAYHQAHQQYTHLSLGYFSPFLVIVLVILSLFFLNKTPTPQQLLMGFSGAFALMSLVTFAFLGSKYTFSISVGQIQEKTKHLLGFGGWLLLAHLLFVLFQRGDMLLLSHFSTKDSLGLYAVSIRISNLMTFILDPIHPLFLPKTGRIMESDSVLKSYRKKCWIFGIFVVCIAGCLLVSRDWLILILFGEKFLAASASAFWLILGMALFGLTSPFQYLFFAENKIKKVFLMHLFMLIGLVGGGIVLIPYFLEKGAAMAVCLGYFLAFTYVFVKAPRKSLQ